MNLPSQVNFSAIVRCFTSESRSMSSNVHFCVCEERKAFFKQKEKGGQKQIVFRGKRNKKPKKNTKNKTKAFLRDVRRITFAEFVFIAVDDKENHRENPPGGKKRVTEFCQFVYLLTHRLYWCILRWRLDPRLIRSSHVSSIR